jgi:hypothetical protein
MELLHLHHRNISLPENPLLLYMEIIKHRSSAKDCEMRSTLFLKLTMHQRQEH